MNSEADEIDWLSHLRHVFVSFKTLLVTQVQQKVHEVSVTWLKRSRGRQTHGAIQQSVFFVHFTLIRQTGLRHLCFFICLKKAYILEIL